MTHYFEDLAGNEVKIETHKVVTFRCYDLPVSARTPEVSVYEENGEFYIDIPDLSDYMIKTEKEAYAYAALFAEAADELTRLRIAEE